NGQASDGATAMAALQRRRRGSGPAAAGACIPLRFRVSAGMDRPPEPRALVGARAPPADAPGCLRRLYVVAVSLGPSFPIHTLRWVADPASRRAGRAAVLWRSGAGIGDGGVRLVAGFGSLAIIFSSLRKPGTTRGRALES